MESSDIENRRKGPRTPSQLKQKAKLDRLINQIRAKKEGETK